MAVIIDMHTTHTTIILIMVFHFCIVQNKCKVFISDKGNN